MRPLIARALPVFVSIIAACGGTAEKPSSNNAGFAGSAADESSSSDGARIDIPAQPTGHSGASNSPSTNAGPLGSTTGAITLVERGEEARFDLHDGRTVSLTLTGYDSANRSSFHYALLDSSGSPLEAREVTYGPQDIGGELEVHKTSFGLRAVISIPKSTRWISPPTGVATTAATTPPTTKALIGDTFLLNLGEEGHISINGGRDVQLRLTGFDPASGRSQFHYVVVSATNGSILETRDLAFGPQDIGSEIEVLKSSRERALVTLAASKQTLQALDTTRGSAILFQESNEAASVALPIDESLLYVGHDAVTTRSSFRYQAQNHFNQLITMGPQDIGWEMEGEMEVLKTAANRSLVTLAVSNR